MRALIVAGDVDRRDALANAVRRAGHDVCRASDPTRVTDALRRALPAQPDIVLVDIGGGAGALRRLVERVRHATEGPLPALLLLPEGAPWLRGSLPPDMQPAVTVAAYEAGPDALARAFADVDGLRESDAGPAATPPPASTDLPFAFDGNRREVRGPSGVVQLTPSESVILGALVREPDGVVAHEDLARDLWGTAFSDPHSRNAVRSHVYTLRRKLSRAGLDGIVVALLGVGYRLASGDED